MLLPWYYGLRGLALLALPYMLGSSQAALAAFAVFYGLDWIATVPPTVALAPDTFGRERVGVVLGWIFAAHRLGAAFAAWAAGAVRGWTGSYGPAFIAVAAICLLASAMVMTITRSPREPVPEPAAA